MKKQITSWLIKSFEATVSDKGNTLLINFYGIGKMIEIDWERMSKLQEFNKIKSEINYIISNEVFKR